MTGRGGFHDGERAVQQRAGVSGEAARLSGMLAPPELRGAARFLAERTFAALTARGHDGRLWISPLLGSPGFLDTGAHTLSVGGAPPADDPLHRLPAGQPVGLVAVDFATRRRLRVNGTLVASDSDGLRIDVDQAYGNCPQYIRQRTVVRVPHAPSEAISLRRGSQLTAVETDIVRAADTFFLGTTHPSRGNDASHRGGPTGFVRVDGAELWWPDYPGNNMFNSLGNLAVDEAAALLFLDFASGGVVQLSGSARIEWTASGVVGDDGRTGRRVRFVPERVVGRSTTLRADAGTPSPHNPILT